MAREHRYLIFTVAIGLGVILVFGVPPGDFILWRQLVQIRGRVLNPAGVPVAEAEVFAIDAGDRPDDASLERWREEAGQEHWRYAVARFPPQLRTHRLTTTDAQGRFTLVVSRQRCRYNSPLNAALRLVFGEDPPSLGRSAIVVNAAGFERYASAIGHGEWVVTSRRAGDFWAYEMPPVRLAAE